MGRGEAPEQQTGFAAGHHHQAAYPQKQQTPPASVHSVAHPEIGVMYASENSHRTLNASSSVRQLGGKVVRDGGRNLINAMKNLSLKGSNRDLKQENEWETRWDEDDDDDSDDDTEDDRKMAPIVAAGMKPAPAAAPKVHLRPGMDNSHSSAVPLKRPPTDVIPPTPVPVRDLLSTDEIQKLEPASPTPTTETTATAALQSSSSWDSQSNSQTAESEASYEKPNVQMFLPLLRVLGKGSFGKVVLVQKRQGTDRGSLFAMKILRKAHLVKRRQIERTRTERKVLSVVDHPFIMKLHYAFQTEDKLYLVLDYCPGGELFFHLSRFRRFPERVARFYAAELLLAIGHLHKRGIIYRDLKPENVLLDADGHVKLGDFGLAKAGIRHPCEGAISMCGTPEYMAPEVLAGTGHGFCVDYWGLGMLVYEMMTGLPPWYTTDRAKLFRRLKSAPLDIPNYFSPHAANCVSQLLERNPRRRLGVTGIRTAMEQEYFRSINWRALYARRVEAPVRPCEAWNPNNGLAEEEKDGQGNNTDGQQSSTQSSASEKDVREMKSHELDAATANFDNTFTKMPVNSEDLHAGQASNNDGGGHGGDGSEELHENTFVGFTFDVQSGAALTAPQSSGSRQRVHNQQYEQQGSR